MSFLTEALKELGVEQYVIYGANPTTEQEFVERFKLIVGKDSQSRAILSSDLSSMTVTWDEISKKVEELKSKYPLVKLREERNRRLAETDFWALSDQSLTEEQRSYRQALRDITNTYSNLNDVIWPEKP